VSNSGSHEEINRIVDLGARHAVSANGKQLTREPFETTGAAGGGTVSPAPTTPFGQNVHSKSFFESAIAASWQKSTQGIFDTGRWLQQAREELDPDAYNALQLPFCARTRQRLIAIAGHLILATHVSQLPPSWATLYALIENDNEVLLQAALADGRVHPGLQRKDVRSALGLPPKPLREARKKNGRAEAPLDPAALWKTFSTAAKRAILDSEGRSGLAALMSQKLVVDLVDHLIRQEMVGASTKLKPAVILTAILRATLDSAVDSNVVFGRFKAKLQSFGLDLHDVSVALKKQKKGR
jgi:hypothetical protein